jgi:hypothetical protein
MNVEKLMRLKDELSSCSAEELEDLKEYLDCILIIRTTDIADTVAWIDKQRRKMPWASCPVSSVP